LGLPAQPERKRFRRERRPASSPLAVFLPENGASSRCGVVEMRLRPLPHSIVTLTTTANEDLKTFEIENMKLNQSIKKTPACLLAVALLALGTAIAARGATITLTPRVELRPLTPSDISIYKLTGYQIASGLNTIAIGTPAYLEAQVNIALPATNVVTVTWTLTNSPFGSVAVLTNSPLGTNVPIYHPSDKLAYQIVSRTFFRPDVRGQYTVVATINAGSYGTTNITQTINAGTYLGVATCELCHSGGLIAPDKYHTWANTKHATKFTRSIDGLVGFYSKSCISCHTVGYDTNPLAVNGGFDDIATQTGWTFPTVLTNGNWAAMPAALQNVANIQCENCHGPGSEHAYSLGDTNRISVSFYPGDCGQCHDATTHHIKNPEWNNSKHAISTRIPSGPNRTACARCHTAGGFEGYIENMTVNQPYATNTVYTGITCAACHDPHDASNPHQLRAGSTVTLGAGITVTNAGTGGFCMNCHQSRNGSVTNSIVNYPLLQQTWDGGSSFGPHDSPVADMLEGVNGWTYGKVIPSSPHRDSVTNTCITCHMQATPPSTDPGFLLAGGHTMKMSYNVVTNGVTNTVDLVAACVQCHGPITTFNFPTADYNGDGITEGVQTEVQHLLDQLSTLLPSSAYVAGGNYVADGLVKTPSVKTNWPAKFLQAAYNYQFVNNDKSLGVHNVAYAVGLLKASIGDLTGDANNDGLPDAWQIQYFGSVSSPNAAPNATPAGDGVPNWLKYALGLDPTVPGAAVTGGVVWANGKTIVSPGGTNAVQIYTAAEVAFNTVVGKTYQVQGISSLGGGWQNIGSPIVGTGNSISYVTPTRQNTQQFFRVLRN
jgi:hypothetical protein